MCSILFTNKDVADIDYVNYYQRFRGPDKTSVYKLEQDNYTFLHNLLSITGEFKEQPFIKNDIICLFNGEIYNYQKFGNYNSDGECLIDLYLDYGVSFTKKLDGEFAIIIFDPKKSRLIVSTDTFATKPLWISTEDKIGISSYYSALQRLGFSNIKKIEPNSTKVFSLTDYSLIEENPVFNFNLDQNIDSFERWIKAFQDSIKKRTNGVREKVFIGLSGGYDSGAIAKELDNQNVNFKGYSIIGKESKKVLNDRKKLLKNVELLKLSKKQINYVNSKLKSDCENFNVTHDDKYFYNYKVLSDKASMGLGFICQLASKEGYKIYLSGQGADEIISDYGHNGNKFYPHSQFGGLFPDELRSVFPWRSFYGGSQFAYINKEECIAGTYGIETRYPFLDHFLVQEFLSLTTRLKNKNYKSPIYEYLEKYNFPYEKNSKVGFNPLPKKNYFKKIKSFSKFIFNK